MSYTQSANLHFSNQIESLLHSLKKTLFPKGAGVFEPRLVVVPHAAMKTYIMQKFADDPDLGVAAGMQIVNLSGAWSKLTKKSLPTKLELSLFLQYELISMIEMHEELNKYFMNDPKENRMGPFCDRLATYFLRYMIYGKKNLCPWQEDLWGKVKKRWPFPSKKTANWNVHLFGFTHIPKSYFEFFQKEKATFYLFSPCQIFWGDFYSEKELHKLQFEPFENQNPFLSNWGKVGRKMFIQAEESNISSEEHYVEENPSTCLKKMQKDLLNGAKSHYVADQTIDCFSTPSLLREVEILKQKIDLLYEKKEAVPSDIQVFATDIHLYAPYIEAVFKEDRVIQDLSLQEIDSNARAFSKLMTLCQNRFSLEHVLQVLKYMDFSISQVRKWLEKAHIRWGFSKKQRRLLYLQDFEEEQMQIIQEEGTWEKGLKQLLLGLTDLNALNAIDMTDMEEFNRLYAVIESLADDLSVLYDGTKWTISTWLRYFCCLMDSYILCDLHKDLGELAFSCDHLDQKTFTYNGIKRCLTHLLHVSNQTLSCPHLQAIRFSSFSAGAVLPGKVICLLGMQEESFPKTEEHSSLYFGEEDYRPKKNEEDRYLFLQTLLSARSHLIMSYVHDPAGKLGGSVLIQELLSHIDGAEVAYYPQEEISIGKAPKPIIEDFDLRSLRNCFETDDFSFFGRNCSRFLRPAPRELALEEGAISTKKGNSDGPNEFRNGLNLRLLQIIPSRDPVELNIQHLFRFASNPLRYYLKEVRKITPYLKTDDDNSPYLLNPLLKYHLVRKALKEPIDEVLKKAKDLSEIPVDLFIPLAKEQLQKEVDAWQLAIDLFEAEPKNIEISSIKVGRYTLVGEIRDFSEKGMFVNGDKTLEDRIRFWPQAALMKHMGLQLFFIKEKEPLIVDGDLEAYLDYYCLALKHPSPLLPTFAKPLIEETAEDFAKALKKTKDETWTYLLTRGAPPDPFQIHQTWQPYLQSLFGKSHANI